MLTSTLLMLSLSQLPTPFDFIDNSEIGDATQYIQLRSKGIYEGHQVDKAKGNTVVTGKWELKDDTITVKVSGCKGPACKDAKKDYTAKIGVMAARALTVESTAPAPFFPSGSYYCHYLGCEPRQGIEIVSKGAAARVLHVVEDKLIAKNVGRNTTVVWIGARATTDAPKTRLETCGRDPAKAKAAVEQVKLDLADQAWLGELEVTESTAKDCEWDVRVYVKDDAVPPMKSKR